MSFMQMLKRVLGESDDSGEIRDEDKHSHHSDGVGKREDAPGVSEPLDSESTLQTRSSSHSPHREPRGSVQERLGAAAAEASSLNDGRRTDLRTSDRLRRRKHYRVSTLPFCVILSNLCLLCSLVTFKMVIL